MTQLKHSEMQQPDRQHHNTHPVDHLPHLIHTTPLHTTRPEPYRTHQHLALAERITPARKTVAQRARTHPPYPKSIPNRYYRHYQRSFNPDAAFQHLFQRTLHAVPTDQPYTVALDGTTVPRTGNYIPDAHWTPNPANAPFARGLRKAQRFVRAGWLDDAPNARCVPVCRAISATVSPCAASMRTTPEGEVAEPVELCPESRIKVSAGVSGVG
jgi:hypothetical protein